MNALPSVVEFREAAEEWLAARRPKVGGRERVKSTAVFHTLSHEEELRVIRAAADWQKEKYLGGYGALTWEAKFGGAGLDVEHLRNFESLERGYDVPADHELRRITTNLVGPTIRDLGSSYLQQTYVRTFLACERLVCQLFSEPEAGSDLAALRTRARLENDSWVISGSKVWVSGAQFADFGLLLARSDPSATKHAGITAFLLPMDTDGVEIRPIRQMTGGTSFNEVYFDDVCLHDRMRIGDVGAGWTVARTMLTYERNQSGSKPGVGGTWDMLRELAASSGGLTAGQLDSLADVFMGEFLRRVTRQRADLPRLRGEAPGPEGSIGKLVWADSLTAIGDAAASIVGIGLVVDSGEDEGFSWSEHVLGAPGFHIAGGTDEIQRNIIAEGLLGLPREPHHVP